MVKQSPNSIKTSIVIIACKVFQTLLEELLPKDSEADITYMDYGLHVVPKNLTKEIQQVIDRIKSPSLVILGYGLCGNGLVGIQSGIHTLIIPKSDDCIAILMGSYDEYREEFFREPGTYYLTMGWLEAGSNPLSEYKEYIDKYGTEKAALIMDLQYQNYSRLMYVSHNEDDFNQYREQVEEIANFCKRWDMRFEEKLGSDRYIKDLIALTNEIQSNGQQLVRESIESDFVIIQPNNVIAQSYFLRQTQKYS
jgi:hypothetical protein